MNGLPRNLVLANPRLALEYAEKTGGTFLMHPDALRALKAEAARRKRERDQ